MDHTGVGGDDDIDFAALDPAAVGADGYTAVVAVTPAYFAVDDHTYVSSADCGPYCADAYGALDDYDDVDGPGDADDGVSSFVDGDADEVMMPSFLLPVVVAVLLLLLLVLVVLLLLLLVRLLLMLVLVLLLVHLLMLMMMMMTMSLVVVTVTLMILMVTPQIIVRLVRLLGLDAVGGRAGRCVTKCEHARWGRFGSLHVHGLTSDGSFTKP